MLYKVMYKRNAKAQRLSVKYVNIPDWRKGKDAEGAAMLAAKVKYPISAELVLRKASKEEALKEYISGVAVYIYDWDGNLSRIMDSGSYGSHAPADELFYRSVHDVGGYGYCGDYYVNSRKEG